MTLQNPLPDYPPIVPQETDSAPKPTVNPSSNVYPSGGYSDITDTVNANGMVIPYCYGNCKTGGLLIYRSRSPLFLFVVYIWTMGGAEGITRIRKIILNDVIELDTDLSVHGVPYYLGPKQGNIAVVNYFGKPDQVIDPWLETGLDLPGFDENFVIPGNDGSPLGIAYSVVRIPSGASLVSNNQQVVELFGYPENAQAIIDGIGVRRVSSAGFAGGYATRTNPIDQAVDYLYSKPYGVGRSIDFVSANEVRTFLGESIPYETATGQSTVPRGKGCLRLTQFVDLPTLLRSFEEYCQCWINDDGETLTFIADKSRATDLSLTIDDFIEDLDFTTSTLSNVPNKVTVNFMDEKQKFNQRSVYVQTTQVDAENIKIKESVLDRMWLCLSEHAGFAATKALAKSQYEFLRVKYRTHEIAKDTKRGHIHSLSHPYCGDNVKVRVLNINWLGENIYEIEAEGANDIIYQSQVFFTTSKPSTTVNLIDPPLVENLKLTEIVQTVNNDNIARVKVTWDTVTWEGLTGYVVEYYQQGILINRVTTGVVENLIIGDFTERTPLTVRIRVKGEYALGEWKEEQITPQGVYKVPEQPTGFNVVPINNTLLAVWNPLTNQPGITEYELRYYATDYFTDGVYIDRIVGTQLIIQSVPTGTWKIGLAAVNQINEYSTVAEDTVTVTYDDDLLLSNVLIFTDWQYQKPVRDYDFANEINQLIGGTAGMIQEKDTKRMTTSYGAVYTGNDLSTEKSVVSWDEQYSGPMDAYSGTLFSNLTNDELCPDTTFGSPGSWTLGAGWSIAGNVLTANNANGTTAAIQVLPRNYQNTIVKIVNTLVKNSFTTGFLGYTIAGRTQGNKKYLAKNEGVNFVYQSPTDDADTTFSFNGNNNLTAEFNLVGVKFSEPFITTYRLDLGGIISASFNVTLDSNFYDIYKGSVSTFIEANEIDDDGTYQVYAQNELISRVRYVRVKVRGDTSDTVFSIDISAIKVTIKASQKFDSGLAVWGQLPDVTNTLSFIPSVVGGNGAAGWLIYAPQDNTDVPVVGNTMARSFFIQFITGTDVTTRQCVFSMGTPEYSGFSVYVENGELIVVGRLTEINLAPWPHAYSRQQVKTENFYTVGIVYDYSQEHVLTYINGKRANERTEFIEEYTPAPAQYTEAFPPEFQSTSAYIKLGVANAGDSAMFVMWDGTFESVGNQYNFQGTVIRYMQFDGVVTDSEMRALYQTPWDSTAYPVATRVLDCKPGDASQTTGVCVDHSGTGRQMQVLPVPTLSPGLSYISTSLLPVIAVLNKNFSKLFSVTGFSTVSLDTEVIVGNVETGGPTSDTVELHLAQRNTFQELFEDVSWRIIGI